MTLAEFDRYIRSILSIKDLEKSDSSLNGIQLGDMHRECKKVVFAVDACMQTFTAAAGRGGDCLFVHHGLFWGKPLAIVDTHFERVRYLIENNIALYAVHLPLDMHREYGNNAGLARKLGLIDLEEFGEYHGFCIGWKGTLPHPLDLEGILSKIGLNRDDCLAILPFGPDKIERVAIISGGASHEITQAIDAGADLYITGEASHVMYHLALEGNINVIAGGHYNTETWGVNLLKDKCAADTGLVTEFIDGPTGL